MNFSSLSHLDMLDAYLQRINFLERKYPDLASKDKIMFCTTCVNLYMRLLRTVRNKIKK